MCPNQPLHIHALAGGLALPDLERDGQSKVRLRVVDGDPPTANDWLALNPFTISNHHKAAIPQLLWSHAFLIASNGIASRIGFLRANRQRFFSWKRIASEDKPPLLQPNSAHIPPSAS